jgi:hypothetical protein
LLSYIIALALAGAVPSQDRAPDSAGPVSVTPGQPVTLALGPNGAEPTSADALRANGPRFTGKAVRFEMLQLGDQGILLTVQNGYDQTLVYKAVIHLASGAQTPTSTCPVMAHIAGIENWQDPIVSIDISDLALTDSKEMICK